MSRRGRRYAQTLIPRKTRRTTIPRASRIQNTIITRAFRTQIGDFTNLLHSSHPDSLVKLPLATPGTRSVLCPSAMFLGRSPQRKYRADPFGSTLSGDRYHHERVLSCLGASPASSANRVNRVNHASCVLAHGIRLSRVSSGHLGSPPGSQIRGRLAFRCWYPRSHGFYFRP